MKRRTLRITSVFMIAFCVGFGQWSYAQTQITLQDALTYALNNSEIIQQAKLDIENAQHIVKENQAGVYPQINIRSSVTGNPIVQQFVLPAESFGGPPGEFMSMKVGQNFSAMSQVALSQQIYNQQLFSGLKAAKSSVELYELINQVAEENIIQQVAVSYYQVLVSEENISVIDANIEQMEALKTMMEGQLEVGLLQELDVDRIRVNLNSLKTQRRTIENVVVQQKNLLKYLMGMSINEDIVLINPLADDFVGPKLVDKMEENALMNLTDYQLLEKQDELLTLQKKVQQASAYPSLSLDANYTYNTQSDKFNLYSRKALNYDMSSVNLTLSIPIFDGLARRHQVKQTEIARKQLEIDKKQTLNELNMNMENAISQMNISLETIENQIENVELAERVYASTKNNYVNGLAPLTDLLNAETELIAAQKEYNEAVLNFKMAEIELLKTQGKIKELLND